MANGNAPTEELETLRSKCEELEAALSESEERFRTLVQNAPDMIVLLDAETGLFVDANDNALRTFGFTLEELQKVTPGNISPEFQPDGRRSDEGARDVIAEAVAGGAPIFEWTHMNRDGKPVPCEIRLVRLVSKNRVLIRGSMTDISERKLVERKMKHQLAELERSNSELEEFAYVASHDLQSPLKAIVNWVQIANQIAPEPKPEGLAKAFENIEDNSIKAINLIKDLMQMARLNVRDQKVETIDLNALAHDVVEFFRDDLDHASAHVVYKDLPNVPGIRVHMEGLFRNLLQNAIQYRDVNRDLKIEIGAGQCDSDEVEITFRDNGIGIAPENQRKVFDMFTRLSNAPVDRFNSGIGLSYCKKIVELSNGRIWVDSELGAGSTFHFTYPLQWRSSN